MDVISAYPLVNHVIVNNLYIFITGHDTSKEVKHRFDLFLQVVLRFINAVLPILAAMGVANLIYVLKYAGLAGFMCFMFPFLLQMKSIYTCRKRFCLNHVSLSGSHPALQQDEPTEKGGQSGPHSPVQKDPDGEDDKGPDSKETSSKESGKKETKVDSLISSKLDKKLFFSNKDQDLYMTPYSSVLISHPIAVWIVGFIGSGVFILACLSLFLHPKILNCETLMEELLALIS